VLKIRKIVCPVDFSDESKRALEHAAVLARWYEADLAVLHVMPLLPTMFGMASPVVMAVEPATTQAVIRDLTAFVGAACPPLPNMQTVIRSGSPASEILRFAGEAEAELLVLGTHGRTGFERFVLGSVTEKVLRKATCSVLTVPRRSEGQPERPLFGRIVCGADFSPASDRAVAYALSLAQEANAHFMLLHVLDWLPGKELADFPQFDAEAYRKKAFAEARRQLEERVPEEARDWCEPDLRISCGKAYRQILRLAEEEHADLVVLGVHGATTAVDRMLFGSTTQHVVRQAACPVLTIRG
jgi:nucleotide-binding universal stress UspA family protein